LDIYVLQIATYNKCSLHATVSKFLTESTGEKIVKIG